MSGSVCKNPLVQGATPVSSGNEFKERSWKQQAGEYLSNQAPTTVLLFLIFGVMCYGGWYTMTTAIPAHLKQIQDGYHSQTEMFKQTLVEDRMERKEQFKEVKQSFDKATETFSKAVEAMERSNK